MFDLARRPHATRFFLAFQSGGARPLMPTGAAAHFLHLLYLVGKRGKDFFPRFPTTNAT